MKKVYLYACTCPLFFSMAFMASCHGQAAPDTLKSNHPEVAATPKTDPQIAEYVVEVFEDSHGNLWFGTIDKGVARYNGTSLTYFSTVHGLCGNTVASIAEDSGGNMWFGTHSGLSRYDGKTFANFTKKEGLCNDRVSNLLIDKTGTVWVGTWGGVCRYNGVTFTDFPLPNPANEIPLNQSTMNWVTQLMEDKQGNIWFSRSGYGVCKYAGGAFTHFTKKDGLASNCVQAMQEDKQGNIWFGSRVAEKDNANASERTGDGGLSRYDGKTFMQYPGVEGLSKNDIYAICEDKAGNIWIGANGYGVYRYDGKKFTLMNATDRKDLMPYGYGIQSMLEDKNGTLWLGLSGGLFRLEDSSIINVAQHGPWK